MYSALEVARHVINYSNSREYSVSNLKLQKLLYFIQAYFLIASCDGKPCFREKITAWDFGPVVPVVYSEFKQFGSTDIPTVSYYYDDRQSDFLKDNIVKFRDDVISNKDKKMIDDVIEKFSKYTASDLVKLTHNQAPWRDAYARGHNRVISEEAIRSYFGER